MNHCKVLKKVKKMNYQNEYECMNNHECIEKENFYNYNNILTEKNLNVKPELKFNDNNEIQNDYFIYMSDSKDDFFHYNLKRVKTDIQNKKKKLIRKFKQDTFSINGIKYIFNQNNINGQNLILQLNNLFNSQSDNKYSKNLEKKFNCNFKKKNNFKKKSDVDSNKESLENQKIDSFLNKLKTYQEQESVNYKSCLNFTRKSVPINIYSEIKQKYLTENNSFFEANLTKKLHNTHLKKNLIRTDFFASKLAIAVDDIKTSDSDENFIYENFDSNEFETISCTNNTLYFSTLEKKESKFTNKCFKNILTYANESASNDINNIKLENSCTYKNDNFRHNPMQSYSHINFNTNIYNTSSFINNINQKKSKIKNFCSANIIHNDFKNPNFSENFNNSNFESNSMNSKFCQSFSFIQNFKRPYDLKKQLINKNFERNIDNTIFNNKIEGNSIDLNSNITNTFFKKSINDDQGFYADIEDEILSEDCFDENDSFNKRNIQDSNSLIDTSENIFNDQNLSFSNNISFKSNLYDLNSVNTGKVVLKVSNEENDPKENLKSERCKIKSNVLPITSKSHDYKYINHRRYSLIPIDVNIEDFEDNFSFIISSEFQSFIPHQKSQKNINFSTKFRKLFFLFFFLKNNYFINEFKISISRFSKKLFNLNLCNLLWFYKTKINKIFKFFAINSKYHVNKNNFTLYDSYKNFNEQEKKYLIQKEKNDFNFDIFLFAGIILSFILMVLILIFYVLK